MFILNAELKIKLGKRNNSRLRKLGYIPAIIYKKNEKSIPIKFKKKLIDTFLKNYKSNNKISIKINSDIFNVNIKNIQYHFYKNNIIHIDFIKN